MVLLILGLILFIGLVVVHEWGHFIAAKRNGVDVEEFGIFFPPKIWSRKTKGGWDFSINALPIGGFVRLKGEKDADTEQGTYGAASTSTKVKILLAGVGMNLLIAFLLFMGLAWVGMPQLVDNQFTVASDTKVLKHEVLVGVVTDGSPADKAGLQVRDQLLSIGSEGKTRQIQSASQLPEVTRQFAGKKVAVRYIRDGQTRTASAQLLSKSEVEASRKTSSPKGYLGIGPSEYRMTRSTWSAPVVSAGLIKQFTELTFKGLGTAVSSLVRGDTQKAQENVSGPVGIFAVLQRGSILGIEFIIMIIALISLSLAIFNVLPIPALDGGKLYVTLIARAFNKNVSESVENWVYGAGFAILMVLMVLITVVDIKRFY
jgi:regulator of sigma E protease